MAYGWPGGAGSGSTLGNLAGTAGKFLGGPWGMGLGMLAGGLAAYNNAPNDRDIAGQKMQFSIDQMMRIPQLAAMFRNQMIGASGGQQQNLIGSANAFTNNLSRQLANTNMGNTALGRLVGSMGQSMLGRSMADMYGGYNMAGFNMANQNLMQALQQTLAGWQQPGTQNQVLGAMLGAGGRLADRALYPRQNNG